MVTKKQLAALAKGRAIRAANCKKKNTKAKYTKKQTKRCGRIRKGTNISFNQLLGSYQADYEKRKPKEEPEPIEASPTMWQHVSNAANASWKALHSVANTIGDGLYAIGDGEWRGTEYLFNAGKKGVEKTDEVIKMTKQKANEIKQKAGEIKNKAIETSVYKNYVKPVGDKVIGWASSKKDKARDLVKQYGSDALDLVKTGGTKALDLLKAGGKAAMDAIRGPKGRLGAMKVLRTEITNKLDSFETAPTREDMSEINQKMIQVKELLSDEMNENPELPTKIQREVEQLDGYIEKITKEVNEDYMYQ